MRRPTIQFAAASFLLLAFAAMPACQTKTPRQQVLDERAAWKIDLLSWAEGEDGLILSVRLGGPVHGQLESLTFRVEMRSASGDIVGNAWYSADISGVERGGPEDFLLRLPRSAEGPVDQLSIDPVLAPTDEEAADIVELRGL